MLCLLQTCSCGDWLQWLSKIAQIRTVIIEPLQMNAAHSMYRTFTVIGCNFALPHSCTQRREHCVLVCMCECRIAPNYFTVMSYQLAQQQVLLEHSSFCVSFALVLSCLLEIWIDEILLTLHILFFSSLAVFGDNASVGKGNDACFLLLSGTLPSYLASTFSLSSESMFIPHFRCCHKMIMNNKMWCSFYSPYFLLHNAAA